MIKVQNVAPYAIETPTGTIESAHTGDVESLDSVAGLLAAGLLVEVDDSPDGPPEPAKTATQPSRRHAKADTK